MVTIVTGIQWGDEGKGKITHFLSSKADIVIRATGGNNAGHTVVLNDNKKFKLHLLPSSIIRTNIVSIIGNGTVLNLSSLLDEINELLAHEVIITEENLKISDRAHIVLPWHKDLDKIYEYMRSNPIGTTNRGIGPCYADKTQRIGIRLCDLFLEEDILRNKLIETWNFHSIILNQFKEQIPNPYYIEDINGKLILDIDKLVKQLLSYRNILGDYICDISPIISKGLRENKNILIEGAQAYFLDIDHGTYPNVTSSNCISSGSLTGCGIGPTFVKEIVGITKAYTTRVGKGPFPTEQDNEIGNKIRNLGNEYGTTTGRPRRCGWLDLIMLKQAITSNGITSLCINHLDTIGKFDELKVCVAYKYKGTLIDYVPTDLENCEPEYITFKGGWSKEDICINNNAKHFLLYLKSFLSIPIKYIGIGPKESDMIII